jgi:hypothetical protein
MRSLAIVAQAKSLGKTAIGICAFVFAFAASRASAADLQPRTSDAYHAYVGLAQQAFEERVLRENPPESTRDGVIFARPARSGGIIGVSGGLVHHWAGAALLHRVTLESVLKVSTDYSSLRSIYKEVVSSQLLEHEGNTYRVRTRLKEAGAGVTAVLDITSTIDYRYPTTDSVFVLSNADEIRQVVNPGSETELLLPVGHDSGYLWRANSFMYLAETGNGVYIEMETLGLSRPFPPLLSWLIKPVARRLGRKSVDTALQEFVAAVTARPAESTGRLPL